MADLREKLATVALADGVVMCTFADRNYCDLLRHWLRTASNVGRRRVLVFCLDREALDVCAELGAPSLFAPFEGDWLGFLRHRVRIARKMIDMGYSPLLSDIDAVWVRDPIPFTVQHPQDLVFSPGTVQPREAHAAWGNVLCMGYCLLRASPRVADLIDAVLGLMDKMGDQPALNRILSERTVQWEPADLYEVTFRQWKILQSKETRIGQCGDLSIALLPNRLFQRVTEAHGAPLVIHPVAPKVEAKKIALFQEMGLW